MKKWFVHCTTEMGGTDSWELIEAETEREAETFAQELAQENFYSYDYEQFEQDCEESGMDYLESEYFDYALEEYNPKEHNQYLMKSDLMEDEK